MTVEPSADAQLRIVPANEASWEDLQAIFGMSDYPGRCNCQRFKSEIWIWHMSPDECRARLRNQTHCDEPESPETTGLVAYLAATGEPVGWVAVEPRIAYPGLRTKPTVWRGRSEDKDDAGVWAVTCFAIRKGYRGRGITYALAESTVEFARARGARAIEGYAMLTEPGREITWGELHVGACQVFEEAGFEQVSQPSKRRVVMRLDFDDTP